MSHTTCAGKGEIKYSGSLISRFIIFWFHFVTSSFLMKVLVAKISSLNIDGAIIEFVFWLKSSIVKENEKRKIESFS